MNETTRRFKVGPDTWVEVHTWIEHDDDPDLSYLDQECFNDGDTWGRDRIESYGDTWEMIVLGATVSIQRGPWHMQGMGCIGGVESDAGDYVADLHREMVAEAFASCRQELYRPAA